MNFSFMTFSCPELDLDEVLAVAKKTGYAAVEPRVGSGQKHGIEIETTSEERAEIKEKVAASGIAISCIATSCAYSDPAKCAEKIELTRSSVDLAADIGCERLRVFGGKIADGINRSQAIENLIAAFKQVAEYAASRKVIICFETHDDWCNPEHVAKVLREVNHPAIAVNWDIMHPVRVADFTIDASFEALKPWIKHLHVHDGSWNENDPGSLVLQPIGKGKVDHKRALELLATTDYNGYISGEWIEWKNNPYERHLPEELATLRTYEKDICLCGKTS